MNVLFVCHYNLYKNYSSSFVHNQARAFAKEGHTIKVIIPVPIFKKDPISRELVVKKTVDGVDLVYYKFFSLSNLGRIGNLNSKNAIAALYLLKRKILGNYVPDLIVSHTIGLDSSIGIRLKTDYHNVVFIVATHGSDTLNFINMPLKGKKKMNYAAFDYIVTVSNKLKMMLDRLNLGLKVICIHNGFNDELISSNKKKAHSVIQVSALIPCKHVDTTILAFSLVKKGFDDATLTIVGTGPEEFRLKQMCYDLRIEESVRFTGQLSNSEVMELLSKTEIFSMISSPEGFGIVYLEAMASGCVVFGTENEGIADVIHNERNGFLIEPYNYKKLAEKICYCFNNNMIMTKLRLNALCTAEEYTWIKNVAKYEQIVLEK